MTSRLVAYLIDADSFQFGPFLCRVFTARFVDPLLCVPDATQLLLHQPHTAASDGYAYTVMLMQCLLFVGPYGGVYRPKDPAHRVPHEARPLHRMTIFHPEVQYPKPAIPYGTLPDELLPDKGIVRVEPQHGQLVQTRVFPDTEPYVDSACHLFAGQQGMYVVDRQNIYVLTIA